MTFTLQKTRICTVHVYLDAQNFEGKWERGTFDVVLRRLINLTRETFKVWMGPHKSCGFRLSHPDNSLAVFVNNGWTKEHYSSF